MPSNARNRVKQMVERLRVLPNKLSLILDSEVGDSTAPALTHASGTPAIMLSGRETSPRQIFMKRTQDLILGALITLAAALPMAVIAILIKMDSPGPAIFAQKRQGFNNKDFTIFKFRTMRQETCVADGEIVQVKDGDDRTTKLGRFLRKTSLDELPQIFNVLRGDMSLVGPRPHVAKMKAEGVYTHELVKEYAHRHRMKPGITGWAQVNGSRGALETSEDVKRRVHLDVEYIERASLLFDLEIMVRTLTVFLGDDDNVR